MMWLLWLYLSAIFGILHGAIPDIGCGQHAVGIAPKGEIAYFRLINNQHQDVSLKPNTSVVSGSVLKIKDSEGRYIESAISSQCDQKECNGTVFTLKALPRGVYTVEIPVDEDGGDFEVNMKCSIDGHHGFHEFEGTAMDIYCGQTTTGNTNGNETIYLQFTNDEEQNVIIVDQYDSFMHSVTISDNEGRYIDSGFTTDCNGEDCDGNAVMVKALSPGMYTAEMTTSGDGGEFKVDMMCSGKPLDGEGLSPSARARRLRSVFSDWEIDDWLDTLDDIDIDYFYNLMMHGQIDDIMDAFRYDVEYDDYDRHQNDYYLEYDGPNAAAVLSRAQSDCFCGNDDKRNSYRNSPVKNGYDKPLSWKPPNGNLLRNIKEFGDEVVASGLCSEHFTTILQKATGEGLLLKTAARKQANACGLFGIKPDGELKDDAVPMQPMECKQGDQTKYTIKPMNYKTWPKKQWGCGLGTSANAPFPLTIEDSTAKDSSGNPIINPYPFYLKKYPKKNGAANDYIAMKAARWINDIFGTIYQKTSHRGLTAPLIKVFDIMPQYQPNQDRNGAPLKFTDANGRINDDVKNMHFLSVYETKYGGEWVKIDGEKKGTINVKDCCFCHKNLLNSLRGAFLMSMLLGAKDRHTNNIGTADECTIMNIDYGHFLGQRATPENILAPHYVFPINSVVAEQLGKVYVDDKYLTNAGIEKGFLEQMGVAAAHSDVALETAVDPRLQCQKSNQQNANDQNRGTQNRWNLLDVLIAALYRDVQDLRGYFEGPYQSESPGQKWDAFRGTTYFPTPDIADQWIATTTVRDLRFFDYMSYMLFGRRERQPKPYKVKRMVNGRERKETIRRKKGMAKVEGAKYETGQGNIATMVDIGAVTPEGFRAFKDQVMSSIPGGDWVLNAILEHALDRKVRPQDAPLRQCISG